MNNEPIKVTISTDHLTMNLMDLPDPGTELWEKFNRAIPRECTKLTQTLHGNVVLMIYGNKEQLFNFMLRVTYDFDLLVV